MLLYAETAIADRYTSPAQRARVISEAWFGANAYCLGCERSSLVPTPTNHRATDFTCPDCGQAYELKTCKSMPARRLVDGEHNALMDRIYDGSTPALMILERDFEWRIRGLTAIHHSFLTKEVIEARKPLSKGARRAGWIGCNIRLDLIAADAKLQLITNGREIDPCLIRSAFQRLRVFTEVDPNARGWTTLTLMIVRDLRLPHFSIEDLYAKEHLAAAHYPNNRNIRAKMRQQLQVLRDLGFIQFDGGGRYTVASQPGPAPNRRS